MIQQDSSGCIRMAVYWHDCCTCGVPFAVTKDYDAWRQKDGDCFYCPNGHKQSYPGEAAKKDQAGDGETEEIREKRRQLMQKIHEADQLQAKAEEALAAAKAPTEAPIVVNPANPADSFKQTADGRLKCPKCGRGFRYLSGIKKHLRREHSLAITTEGIKAI